jgi:hypothetical protein
MGEDPLHRPHQPDTCDPNATARAKAKLARMTARRSFDSSAAATGPRRERPEK